MSPDCTPLAAPKSPLRKTAADDSTMEYNLRLMIQCGGQLVLRGTTGPRTSCPRGTCGPRTSCPGGLLVLGPLVRRTILGGDILSCDTVTIREVNTLYQSLILCLCLLVSSVLIVHRQLSKYARLQARRLLTRVASLYVARVTYVLKSDSNKLWLEVLNVQ